MCPEEEQSLTERLRRSNPVHARGCSPAREAANGQRIVERKVERDGILDRDVLESRSERVVHECIDVVAVES